MRGPRDSKTRPSADLYLRITILVSVRTNVDICSVPDFPLATLMADSKLPTYQARKVTSLLHSQAG